MCLKPLQDRNIIYCNSMRLPVSNAWESFVSVLRTASFFVVTESSSFWLSNRGGEQHQIDPQRYLTSILAKIGTTLDDELEQFLPEVWKQEDAAEPTRKTENRV